MSSSACSGVDLVGKVGVGGEPREDERHPVARRDLELGDRRQVLAVQLDRRAEAERVGPGDRDPRVVDPTHPRHDLAVVEADHELGAHRHGPLDALDDPDDVGRLARGGMKSITRTAPSSVSWSVSRTSVSWR